LSTRAAASTCSIPPDTRTFSEDTYRTLMAADSAVMVIDGSKGVEPQTSKLFKVCAMRHIPIFTFINKMDRDALDTFDLLDDIEKNLGVATCPVNWPIGSGKNFKGLYDRELKDDHHLLRHAQRARRKVHGGAHSRCPVMTGITAAAPGAVAAIGQEAADRLCSEIDLLDGASEEFDLEEVAGPVC
jgi:peptide chain release factor 3